MWVAVIALLVVLLLLVLVVLATVMVVVAGKYRKHQPSSWGNMVQRWSSSDPDYQSLI